MIKHHSVLTILGNQEVFKTTKPFYGPLYSPLSVAEVKSSTSQSTPTTHPRITAKNTRYSKTWKELATFQCRALPPRAVGANGSLASRLTLECCKEIHPNTIDELY
jgi:hypothetical protein